MQYSEVKEIAISAILLAIAFGISFSGGFVSLFRPVQTLFAIAVSLIAVSSGFIMHELGHRFMARRYKCRAEYRMWPTGLAIALAMSLFGFVFAAPGAVVIYPRINLWGRTVHLSRKDYGIISLTGPIMNMILAGIFAILNVIYPSFVFTLGKEINLWLAIFNLIPFPPFDGIKIFAWNRGVWLITIAIAIAAFLM